MTLPGPQRLIKAFNYEYGYRSLNIGKLLTVSTLLIGVSGLSHAQSTDHYKTIYKSTGEFGEVKYSQFEPDAGIKSEVIQMRSDGRQSQPGLFATTDVYQISTHQISNNQSPSSRSTKSHTPNTSNTQSVTLSQCQKLNRNLTNLQAGGEIYESKANNERRYLTPIEVTVKIEDTRKLLTQYCKNLDG